jgi:hypothetical protein
MERPGVYKERIAEEGIEHRARKNDPKKQKGAGVKVKEKKEKAQREGTREKSRGSK